MAKKPITDDDDAGPLEDDKPTKQPKAPPAEPTPQPSRFHPRFLKEAEGLGISEGDIEACKDNSELRELIKFEKDSIAEEQTRNRNTPRHREPAPQPAAVKQPDPDPDYAFLENVEHVDPAIVKEMKRLGVSLLKATKKGDKDRVDALQEQIDELKQENANLKASNSPQARMARKVLEKYPHLFGTKEEREAEPHGRFAMQMKWLEDYIFVTMQEQGKLTGRPEKDIPYAIAQLFPGAKPAGTDAQPEPQKPANGTTNRIATWNNSGTPPTSQRNGSDTVKPGGKRAAAAKVREKMRADGYDVQDDSDDLDEDDDI